MAEVQDSSESPVETKAPNGFTKQQRMEAYKHWLADPCSTGTKADFAHKHGLTTDRILYDYEKEDGFWDEVWKLFSEHYLQGQLPTVNKRVIQKAKNGDRWAVELILHLAGRLSKRTGEPTEVKIPEEVVIICDGGTQTEKADS